MRRRYCVSVFEFADYGYWWSIADARFWYMTYGNTMVYSGWNNTDIAFSLRCVRD